MKKNLKFYIGTRHNPQFKKPYYVTFGQLTKTAAKKAEKCLYGSMELTPYETEKEYNDKISQIKESGFNIHTR